MERPTLDRIKEKLAAKKREAEASKVREPVRYDLQGRVAEAEAAEQERKVCLGPPRIILLIACGFLLCVCCLLTNPNTPIKKQQRQRKEAKRADDTAAAEAAAAAVEEATGGVDTDMAALMGFGAFGTSKK